MHALYGVADRPGVENHSYNTLKGFSSVLRMQPRTLFSWKKVRSSAENLFHFGFIYETFRLVFANGLWLLTYGLSTFIMIFLASQICKFRITEECDQPFTTLISHISSEAFTETIFNGQMAFLINRGFSSKVQAIGPESKKVFFFSE